MTSLLIDTFNPRINLYVKAIHSFVLSISINKYLKIMAQLFSDAKYGIFKGKSILKVGFFQKSKQVTSLKTENEPIQTVL